MANDTVDLWALDEVHFQQQGSRCRMWVPPETKDPVVYHHPTRKSVGYFAAVRLRDGQGAIRQSVEWTLAGRVRARDGRAERAAKRDRRSNARGAVGSGRQLRLCHRR